MEIPEDISQPNTFFAGQFDGLNKLKVLVVEDNKINQIVTKKFLEKWDVVFDIVDNGQKAIDIVQQKEFDLILMDIQMPVMDGYMATKGIRNLSDEKYKKIPIIALTASGENEIQANIIDVGMTDYITKPFNPNELYSKIKKYSCR